MVAHLNYTDTHPFFYTEVFKILTGKYDTAAAPVMDIYDLKTTRGNDFGISVV